MTSLRFCITTVLTCLLVAVAAAQSLSTGLLTGRGMDAATKLALSGAQVGIFGFVDYFARLDGASSHKRNRPIELFGEVLNANNTPHYIAERYGVHKYRADPDSPDSTHELALFDTTGFAGDLEGISIYPQPGGAGYVVVSNQQANTFRIFPRAGTPRKLHDHPLLASVRLSTHESDGSDVTPVELPGFPGGLFVAM
jgi:hypothetical protein